MFERGDRVLVEGVGGKRAVLRVWEVRLRGLLLCSESGYERLSAGEDAPAVGFPMGDILGPAPEQPEHARSPT